MFVVCRVATLAYDYFGRILITCSLAFSSLCFTDSLFTDFDKIRGSYEYAADDRHLRTAGSDRRARYPRTAPYGPRECETRAPDPDPYRRAQESSIARF